MRSLVSGLSKALTALVLIAGQWLYANESWAEEPSSSLSWQTLTPEIELGELTFPVTSFFSSSVTFIRVSTPKKRVGVIRASDYNLKRGDVRTLCKSSGATACINASFFDENGKPLGLLIRRGIIHQPMHRGGGTITAVFEVLQDGIQILHRDQFAPNGVVEALQAGPRLVTSGLPVQGIRESSAGSNLSGVCIDSSGRLILFRVTSSVFSGSMGALQRLLTSSELSCIEAVNFDGGGSSQLYVAKIGDNKEIYLPGTDLVPVALGIFP